MILILCSRRKMDKIALAAQLLHHVLPRRKRRPRLNADIRRIRVRHMPDTEIRHLRIGYGHRFARFLRAQAHAPCHIFQHDRILIEQLVTQADGRIVFQREAFCLAVEIAVSGKANTVWQTWLRKAQFIVFKASAAGQRNPESRMSADAERQLRPHCRRNTSHGPSSRAAHSVPGM